MKLEFETIEDNLERAKVFGGWLVRDSSDVYHPDHGGSGWDWRIAMTFIPDPNHEWSIKEESEDTPELISGTHDALNKLSVRGE